MASVVENAVRSLGLDGGAGPSDGPRALAHSPPAAGTLVEVLLRMNLAMKPDDRWLEESISCDTGAQLAKKVKKSFSIKKAETDALVDTEVPSGGKLLQQCLAILHLIEVKSNAAASMSNSS